MITETREFVEFIFNLVAQGVTSFRDGVQLSDLGDFVDEAFDAQAAIQGIGEVPGEAASADPAALDALFVEQRNKLIAAGLNPKVSAVIETSAKNIFYIYAAVAASNEEVVA